MGDTIWLGVQSIGTFVIFIVLALWSVRAMRRRRAGKPSALARAPGDPMFKSAPDVTDPAHVDHAPHQPTRADGTSARGEDEPAAHHLSAIERLDGLAEPTDSRP